MNKHTTQSKSTLSLAIALACLSPFVTATQSQETLPVHGQGAPLAPTVILDQPLKVGEASTATASGYSDPDSDPLASWQYEWRDAANGAGSVLGTGASYTPSNTNAVYLRSRALAARGYPEVQKEGAWAEQALTPIGEGVGAQCSGQSTFTSGGLNWTCPLTQSEANKAGIAYQSTYTEAGHTWVLMNWTSANSYCQNYGLRLPSKDELVALYATEGDLIARGWPTRTYYRSSTVSDADVNRHYAVYFVNGVVTSVSQTGSFYVMCVS